ERLPSGKRSVVTQSRFDNIRMFYFNRHLDIHIAYDSSFYDCGLMALKGESPVGIYIRTHSEDNSNNLQFHRCHLEQSNIGATSVKIHGGRDVVDQRHHNIGFFGCHVETRSWNTTLFDVKDTN